MSRKAQSYGSFLPALCGLRDLNNFLFFLFHLCKKLKMGSFSDPLSTGSDFLEKRVQNFEKSSFFPKRGG